MNYPVCRLCIADNSQPLVTVKGFADYTDVNAQDLVPWTPLKAGKKALKRGYVYPKFIFLSPLIGFSSMDESTALFLLRSITEHFISIATEQASTLPDLEGENLICV